MISKNVQLAPLTTLHIGGPAQFFIEIHTEKDIVDAIAHAREHALPLYPLGAGSNVLVPDAGVGGVVLKMSMRDIVFENEGDEVLLIAGAGAKWEDVVDSAGAAVGRGPGDEADRSDEGGADAPAVRGADVGADAE